MNEEKKEHAYTASSVVVREEESKKAVRKCKAKGNSSISPDLFSEVEGYHINLYLCVCFIFSNLVGFFCLPNTFHIYYLETVTHGKLLNRFDITMFWIFMGGFVLSLHFMILTFLSEGFFKKKATKRRVASIRNFMIGAFVGGWLAITYMQWDGIYFANTGRAFFEKETSQLISVGIVWVTAIIYYYVKKANKKEFF